jgi:sigma-54 dependent transcriptional regulator, acetoin dehydrogenase operon transcriptional activator AcoR
LELQTIRRALLAAGGNRAKAAKLLGIGKTTLYRKLKQLDLAG